MRITNAFLAESAAVADGKLTVRGGFLRYYRAGLDRVATVTLVVFTQADTGDTRPEITVGLTTPTGDCQTQQVTLPAAARAGEVSFAGWPLWLPVEINGEYLVTVHTDETSVTLKLTVSGDD